MQTCSFPILHLCIFFRFFRSPPHLKHFPHFLQPRGHGFQVPRVPWFRRALPTPLLRNAPSGRATTPGARRIGRLQKRVISFFSTILIIKANTNHEEIIFIKITFIQSAHFYFLSLNLSRFKLIQYHGTGAEKSASWRPSNICFSLRGISLLWKKFDFPAKNWSKTKSKVYI